MGTTQLDTNDSMNAITRGIDLANLANMTNLGNHFTRVEQDGYHVELVDKNVWQKLTKIYGSSNFSRALFEVILPFKLFAAEPINPLDERAGVKLYEALDVIAAKRCAYLMHKAWIEWLPNVKIVDDDFLKAETEKVISMINETKGLSLSVVSFKKDASGLLIACLTDTRVPQSGKSSTTQIIIDNDYYEKPFNEIDQFIGEQRFKRGDEYWKRNGLLRLAFVIFNSVAIWLKGEHKDILGGRKKKR